MRIFAEIVDASALSLDALMHAPWRYPLPGADVIYSSDACRKRLSPHLAEAVRGLKAQGLSVSVDLANLEELEAGAAAGADYLLSLNEETIGLAVRYGTTPVLIPAVPGGDLDLLGRAIDAATAASIPFIADPVLDPIHFGFAASLGRFLEARRRWPDVGMMMGTGNLTELTDADSSWVTALLAGLCSELSIGNVLVVNVSPHTVRTVEEHDRARRMMFAAKQDHALPRGYDAGLLQIHDRKPYPHSTDDIDSLATDVRDTNFRIMTAPDGVHIFNGKSHQVAGDAFELFPGPQR